jgi:hypothetical protein
MSPFRAGDADSSDFWAGNKVAGSFGALALSLVLYTSIATGWHLFGLAPAPAAAGYRYTQALSQPLLWVVILIVVVSAGVGWLTRRKWAVGLGTMSPFPIAMAIEIAQDPTSHNLLPFEVLITWLPAFLLGSAGAALGRRLRLRQTRDRPGGTIS